MKIRLGFCRVFEPGFVFDASRVFTAEDVFDLRRISKIVKSGKGCVAALSPLVVHEDNHQLLIFKPPGWLSQRDQTGDLSVNEIFAAYLKEKYQKPGNVFCAAVQRLDRPAAGLMILARTSKAAARISAQLSERTLEKHYLAITSAPLLGRHGVAKSIVLTANMAKVDRAARARPETGSQYLLTARLVGEAAGRYFYDVTIETGKFHQIRALMAAHGAPLIGDVKYGGLKLQHRKNAIGLIAIRLRYTHPTTGKEQVFSAPVDTGVINRYFI